MRIATFTQAGHTRIGVVDGPEIIDLSSDPEIPTDMIAFLKTGSRARDQAQRVREQPTRRYPLSEVRLEAPVRNPRKFLGLGGSYESHLREMAQLGIERPKHQIWFNKQVTCVHAPYADVELPKVSAQLDYEGELALIIGKAGRHINSANAREYIAGFTVCNDLSVRDWQTRSPTHTLGKSFDTHGPLGPWLVTPDDLPNIHHLRLRTWVNRELRQDGNTQELIWKFGEMLEELSAVFTLEPGDVLTTGSPAGIGAMRDPPQYLGVGDIVRVEIEDIGFIENRVVLER